MNRRSFLMSVLGVSATVATIAVSTNADAATAPKPKPGGGGGSSKELVESLASPEETSVSPVYHRRWHRPRRRRIIVIRRRRYRRRH